MQIVAWSRVNCNGSMHIIALNTKGSLIFSGHTSKDLRRACKLIEVGGEEDNKCPCARFFRDWRLGERNKFMTSPAGNQIARERYAWNSYSDEEDPKTKLKKKKLHRPGPATLLAHRIVWRRRKARGVNDFKQPALPSSTTKYGSSYVGIGDESVKTALGAISKQLIEWGLVSTFGRIHFNRPALYPEERSRRPPQPIIETMEGGHGQQLYLWLPKPNGAAGDCRLEDSAIPNGNQIQIGSFYVMGGAHPHCKVSVTTPSHADYDTVLKSSDGDNWDFRTICEMLEFRIFKEIISDRMRFNLNKAQANIRQACKESVQRLNMNRAINALYDTHENDATLNIGITESFQNLTLQASAALAAAYAEFKAQVVMPLVAASKKRRPVLTRFPLRPTMGVAVHTPKNYNPQDQLD